jgi:pimeloyl-ACP methyl ester carboxylesterase
VKPVRETSGAFNTRVWQGGAAERPLLYLHDFEQHPGAAPFLARLGETHAVRAPEHPGYGDSTGFEHIEDIFDLTLHYRRLIEGWKLGPVDVVGHGLGGMFAAELAAIAPHLVRRLVLVSPYGLWLDEAPMPDPFTMTPPVLARAKWHAPDQAGAEPSAFDPAGGETIATVRAQNLATATKFLWPIPDRGLGRRLQYVAAPTLVVRGASDGLFPAPYLDAGTRAVAGARGVTLADTGRLPMVEAEDTFIKTVGEFLA